MALFPEAECVHFSPVHHVWAHSTVAAPHAHPRLPVRPFFILYHVSLFFSLTLPSLQAHPPIALVPRGPRAQFDGKEFIAGRPGSTPDSSSTV